MEAGGYTHIAAAPRGSVIEQRTETHTFCVVCCIPRPWGSPLIYIQHFTKRSAPIKHALPATTTQSCTKQKRWPQDTQHFQLQVTRTLGHYCTTQPRSADAPPGANNVRANNLPPKCQLVE